jgi:ferredoxin--NADP+ reductase
VKRNVDILRDYAGRTPSGKQRAIRLRFRTSPVAIVGEGRVEGIELVENELVVGEDGRIRAVATGEPEVVPCGIVFRSVGYHGVPVVGVPFDEQAGTIGNAAGRVLGESGEPLPGLYCTGWIKRGPTGVIGTNKKDGTETAEALLEDARAGRLPPRSDDGRLEELLASRGVESVLYAGWEAIDAAERTAGEPLGRPRVKLRSWDELLAAARRS